MGGRSRSSSANTTTSNIDNSNTQINDNQGVVLDEISDSTITVTDGGAVENAFSFAESSLDSVDNAVDRSLTTVDSTTNRAFDFGDSALFESFDFGRDNLAFSKTIIDEAQETQQSAINLATQAQSSALNKVSELVNSISSGDSARTKQLLIAVAVILLVLGISVFLITRKS